MQPGAKTPSFKNFQFTIFDLNVVFHPNQIGIGRKGEPGHARHKKSEKCMFDIALVMSYLSYSFDFSEN